jgi:hypothetical protein
MSETDPRLPAGAVLRHEQGRIELRAKLTDGKTPAFIHWNDWVVRWKGGIVLGQAKTREEAVADALNTIQSLLSKPPPDDPWGPDPVVEEIKSAVRGKE